MALSRGTYIGSCEILDLLGSGGMGEVYRGRDTKLGRDVAVKALPEAFAHDPARLARFEREAQVLAGLNHPNIAIIHDLKEVHDSRYLILELVEGETLAERIARGPIPIGEALILAGQIADALEAAHEKGVVHRDLKPANVKITPEGRVKVLDFGLAKIHEFAGGAQNASQSPTLSAVQTMGGVILGTAAYMSPEQARGKSVDRRADVWAFGCVLYEMLTSRQTFPNGETVSDTLAGILTRDPDWQALPPSTPQKIHALLERCLRKDAERRLRDVGDARVEIEEARAEAEPRAAAPASGRRREFALAAFALVFFLTTAAGAIRFFLKPTAGAETVRLDVAPPLNSGASSFSISPDGRKLAFVTGPSPRLIWVRALDSGTAQPIPSTDPVASVGRGGGFFWSADSEYIAFVTQDNKLKKVAATGGPAQLLCSVSAGVGNDSCYGTWNAEGVIVLGNDSSPGPLLRVSAGGEPVPATELDKSRKEQSHRYPYFLPDGHHYLYLATGSDARDRVAYVGTLNSKERHPLEGIAAEVKYANGHLIFIRDGALMAQPFDIKRLALTGQAFAIANPFVPSASLAGPFSVSLADSLAYRATIINATGAVSSQLAWFDRNGRQAALAGPEGEYVGPELSPDGNSVAFARGAPRNIWTLDIAKRLASPLTSGSSDDSNPRWSPDGKTIAFQSVRDGVASLYSRAVGVVAEDKLLLKTESAKTLSDWSRDGKYLAYTDSGDIWALPLSGDSKSSEAPKPIQITKTFFTEVFPRISPDGHWIAYVSNESKQVEVYIQSFPEPGFKQQVSTGAGSNVVRWSWDGKELFYFGQNRAGLFSVSTRSAGASLVVGAPVFLYPPPPTGRSDILSVSADGRSLRQLIGATAATEAPANAGSTIGITVILNWAAGRRQ